MTTDITARLAAFAVGTVDVSPSELEAARSMVARNRQSVRSGEPASSKLEGVATRLGGHSPEATVWGSGHRLQAEWAGFLNAFWLCAGGNETRTAVVVPTAAAVAELVSATDSELAVAVLIGLEVAERVVRGLGDRHQARGWDVNGTAGVIASAAVAARLLRLDAERAEQAMGLGGTQLAGFRVQQGTDAPSLHAGKAVLNGIEAARLVLHGLDGPQRVLEGRRGIFALACDDPNPDLVIDGLGRQWISRSLFAAAGAIHRIDHK